MKSSRATPATATAVHCQATQSSASLSVMPCVGTRGVRQLDDLEFECTVVATDATTGMLSLQYLDDGRVEHGVFLDEFLVPDNNTEDGARSDCEGGALDEPQQVARGCGPKSDPVTLHHVLAFVDTGEWLGVVALVAREWNRQVTRPTQWRAVRWHAPDARALRRLRRVLHVDLARICVVDNAECGGQVRRLVETVIIRLAPELTDAFVLDLVGLCPRLRRLEVERCSQLSFVLLYDLEKALQEQRCENNNDYQDEALEAPAPLELSVWLCRNISPLFAAQLAHSELLHVRGPGFYVWEAQAASKTVLEDLAAGFTGLPSIGSVPVLWVPKLLLQEQLDNRIEGALDDLWRWRVPIKRFDSSLVPFVSLVIDGVDLVGLPSAMEDFMRLVREQEGVVFQQHMAQALVSWSERNSTMPPPAPSATKSTAADAQSLEQRAEAIFAQLRQTTQALELQVSQLQSQVQVLALAKDQAQQEYKQAQRALDRVAKDADRALLGLTTTATGAAVAPAPVNGQTTRRTGDDLLPELPHDAILALAGTQLATQHYAVVDGFVGKELSLRALSDIVHLYEHSRAHPAATDPTDDQPVFRMGELAGGHTGRNVRYQMEHVRGDYVLWVDEHDEYCPVSIKQMLRQIDRVVLERLQRWNDELSASALLRNKTMITCYPGNGARYTKHCDNPNQNGRKLTAIVYLNPEWEPTHGGELRLHTDNTTNVPLCVAPLLDRLLLFFSDRRVPHEVLPCFTNRYALTVWYLDYDEFMNAQVFGDMTHDAVEEEERIQQEIKSFAARAASKA